MVHAVEGPLPGSLPPCPPPPPPRSCLPPATVKVAKRELRMECDYRYELQSQQRFKALISADPYTSKVWQGWAGEHGCQPH